MVKKLCCLNLYKKKSTLCFTKISSPLTTCTINWKFLGGQTKDDELYGMDKKLEPVWKKMTRLNDRLYRKKFEIWICSVNRLYRKCWNLSQEIWACFDKLTRQKMMSFITRNLSLFGKLTRQKMTSFITRNVSLFW